VTQQLYYGGVPVPYTVSWSAEGRDFLGNCRYAEGPALRQSQARGQGKPIFSKPHADRQREVIVQCRCDVCGKSLKNRAKVSLSQARPAMHAATPGDILQVEPLLHRECAAQSMRHCPSLKRQLASGELKIRQVFQHHRQVAIMSEQGVFEMIGVRRKAYGHAKVQLVKWRERDLAWLDSDK